MSQAKQAEAECLLGRTWPDRRVAKPAAVDIDVTSPARRKTDAVEVVTHSDGAKTVRVDGELVSRPNPDRKRFAAEPQTPSAFMVLA